MKKVALLVTCLSFTSLISCSTLQHMIGGEQKTDASGLATSPRGDGADVIDPYSLDTKADSQQAASSEDHSNMNMDSLSLDNPQPSSASSDLQTEVQMDQAPMEHTPVAQAPAMDVAPQSEMADASHEEVAVSSPMETPAIEVFDNQSITQQQQRAFSAPRKHSAKIEKKSSQKLAKLSKKDKNFKKLAISKKESKKSKLIAKKSLKKEMLAKGSKSKKSMIAKSSKSKKGMIAKSSKSKKDKIVKGKSSKSTKVVSSKTTKKGKKDRKVASSNN